MGRDLAPAFLEVYCGYHFKQGHGHFIAKRDSRVHGGKREKARLGKKRKRNLLPLGLAGLKGVIFEYGTFTVGTCGRSRWKSIFFGSLH